MRRRFSTLITPSGRPGGNGPAPGREKKNKITLKRIGAGILEALIGTMSPLIPAIIGGSMVKLLAMILDMAGVFGKGSFTLAILNVMGDGAFFFLPIMVAASAAVKFKTNLSLGGSSLAVAFRTKNRELRQTALAAAASAIIAGISEPALYGVAVRLKRPLIACLISGFICGAVAGIGGLASHSMAAPGLFTSVQFFDPAHPMSVVWVVGVMILAVAVSFITTLILGFEDIVQSEPTGVPAGATRAEPEVSALKSQAS